MRFVLLLLLLRNDFAHFTKIAITPVWDLIETWGFREDLPLVFPHDDDDDDDDDDEDDDEVEDNDKDDDNNDRDIYQLTTAQVVSW